MTFDNSKDVKLFYIALSLDFVLLLGFLYAWRTLGISVEVFRLIFVGFLSLMFGTLYLSKPTYFNLKITDKKIIIHYYYLIPFELTNRHKTIEILISDFRKAEVEFSNYGLSQNLILYVADRNRLLSFSPISVFLIKEPMLNEMLKKLQNLYEA
jgi:hypothetical protein